MSEKIFYIETIDPIMLYGTNNVKLERIKTFFPKIRLVARGNQLKIFGSEEQIEVITERLEILVDYILRHNNLPDRAITELIQTSAQEVARINAQNENVLIFGNTGKPIKARTQTQHKMAEQSKENDLLFAIGPAGTGKTYLAIALAIKALRERSVRKIILSRPAVEAEEKLGFLPGDMKDKLDPYLQPLYDALNDMIPARRLADYLKDGIIQIAPLAFMRGRTLSNAFVILDEAQNATVNQLKMFLTRMGENSQFIVTGDITQIDLPHKQNSGLVQSHKLLQKIKGISFINFDAKDIIRHDLVKHIVNAYENADKINH